MQTTASRGGLSTLNLTLTGFLGVVGGVWLIVSPFLLYDGYKAPNNASGTVAGVTLSGQSVTTGADNATIFGIVAGVILIALMAVLILTEKMDNLLNLRVYLGAATVLLGVVTMAAPYLFNYNKLKDPLWNLTISGAIIALIAGFVLQEVYGEKKAGE